MISAHVARSLLTQSCSAEQIVAAVTAIDEGREARLARLRAGAAERQRKAAERAGACETRGART